MKNLQKKKEKRQRNQYPKISQIFNNKRLKFDF